MTRTRVTYLILAGMQNARALFFIRVKSFPYALDFYQMIENASFVCRHSQRISRLPHRCLCLPVKVTDVVTPKSNFGLLLLGDHKAEPRGHRFDRTMVANTTVP